MGIRVIVGHEEGDEGHAARKAVLYDSVTNMPLPTPVFEEHPAMSAEDQANGLLVTLEEAGVDARSLTVDELDERRSKFVAEHDLFF